MKIHPFLRYICVGDDTIMSNDVMMSSLSQKIMGSGVMAEDHPPTSQF
jgi:hypothetical protein